MLTALCWQGGQHLACQPGSCSLSCRRCTLPEPACPCPPSPTPPARLDPHRAVLLCSCKAPLPLCTPWGAGGDFCIFVILVLAPVLWQLPYCISSCSRLPLRSMCQGRSSCMFCPGEKGHRMTKSRVPHNFSSSKAQGIFSRSTQSTRGLIKPATLVTVWVSGTQSHDVRLTGENLAVLCCPAGVCEKSVLQLSREGKFCWQSGAFKASLKYSVNKVFTWTWKHRALLSHWTECGKSKGKEGKVGKNKNKTNHLKINCSLVSEKLRSFKPQHSRLACNLQAYNCSDLMQVEAATYLNTQERACRSRLWSLEVTSRSCS